MINRWAIGRDSMLQWSVEHSGKTVPLDRVDVPEIRGKINPIKSELELLLSTLEEAGELHIVFVIDEDGGMSVSLRGSTLMVNSARDKIGDERRLGMRLS